MDIGNSFENVLDTIIGFLPNLLGFLLILLIGYVIAKIVAGVVRKVLEKVGVDQKVQQSDANRYVDAVLPGARPSAGIARRPGVVVGHGVAFAPADGAHACRLDATIDDRESDRVGAIL